MSICTLGPPSYPEAVLPPEATSPPGTCSAKPFSYFCVAEPLQTGEYNQHV